MVENVESFPPDLYGLPFPHSESLDHTQVDILLARSVHDTAPGITRREGQEAILIRGAVRAADTTGHVGKGRGVEPGVVNAAPARACHILPRGNPVGPERLADGRIDSRILDREGRTGIEGGG